VFIRRDKSVLLEGLADERENLASNRHVEIVGVLSRRGTDSQKRSDAIRRCDAVVADARRRYDLPQLVKSPAP